MASSENDVHKEVHVNACSELLRNHNDGTFLSRIVTGDDTWVHHFEPESKRASLEWRHPSSPRTNKFKTQQSAGKIMATVSWDVSGPILVEYTPKDDH